MDFKTRVQKTKQFVQDHQTSVACVATAIVTWKFTKDITIKSVLDETTDMAYMWGMKAGQLEMLLDESYNFIKSQDLESDFVEFANMVRVEKAA